MKKADIYQFIAKQKLGVLGTLSSGGSPQSALVGIAVTHGAGNRGGFHAFRRFRFAVLRKAGVPENLIKQWMGHSQNLMDLYAAQLRLDMAYRREWCDRAGLGFELGELGYKSVAPIRPLLVA
jgi:integrase